MKNDYYLKEVSNPNYGRVNNLLINTCDRFQDLLPPINYKDYKDFLYSKSRI